MDGVAGGGRFGDHLRGGTGAQVGGDHRRVTLDLGRCALGDLATELDDVDVVADVQNQAHVVIDQEDRHARIDDPPQPGAEFLRLLGVEPGRRFVHADQGGSCGERTSRRDQLALTLADLARHPVGEVANVENVEREVDLRPVPWSGRPDEIEEEVLPRLLFGGDLQVLPDRQIVEQLQRLPRTSEPHAGTLVGWRGGDVAAVEIDAATGRNEARDAVDERRLARSVRADQPDQLAGTDLEVDTVDSTQAPERDAHVGGRQQRHVPASPTMTAGSGTPPEP